MGLVPQIPHCVKALLDTACCAPIICKRRSAAEPQPVRFVIGVGRACHESFPRQFAAVPNRRHVETRQRGNLARGLRDAARRATGKRRRRTDERRSAAAVSVVVERSSRIRRWDEQIPSCRISASARVRRKVAVALPPGKPG